MNESEGKMEFYYSSGEGEGAVALTLPPDASLAEALEGFEMFLRACGFEFDGQIEINGNIDYEMQDPNAEKN